MWLLVANTKKNIAAVEISHDLVEMHCRQMWKACGSMRLNSSCFTVNPSAPVCMVPVGSSWLLQQPAVHEWSDWPCETKPQRSEVMEVELL